MNIRLCAVATMALLASFTVPVWANNQAACEAAAGAYLTGEVVEGPRYASGKPLKGKELSHTHVKLKADQDGRRYDVAMDNVFAAGYDQAHKQVPAPLNSIKVGDRLELCGQLYTSGVGIHWVHTNCGQKPNPAKPNGWVKKFDAAGQLSENLEGSQEYCDLWPQRRR